jgi:hypothetical protein
MVALSRTLLWIIVAIMALSVLFQVWHIWQFVNQGPRFTSVQGQELCEALVIVARESIGFQASGKPLPRCDYERRK